MKEKSLEKLQATVDNYLSDNLNELDKHIISLLKEIMVVEKEYISGEIIFNQLKESYFDTDEVTANFVDKLYNLENEALETYIDIYLEETYEDEMKDTDTNDKIIKLNNLLIEINPELTVLVDKKINNIDK